MSYLILSILLLSAWHCSAKKMQMAFEDVMIMADLIVIGEITQNGNKSYSFQVEETLYGDTSLRTIEVMKWKEWACDTRSFKIAKGQRLVLLLKHGPEGYRPFNDSTGEVPIVKDGLPKSNGYYDLLPYRVSLKDFGIAVRALRACGHSTNIRNDFGYFFDWVWDCSPEQRDAHTSIKDFTAWLFKRLEDRNKSR